jgi:hypothetical protein
MSATYGTPGQPTYSVALDSIDIVLGGLPDNTNNLISAQNIRNAIFTLYNDLLTLSQSVSTFVGSVSASNIVYDNPNPSLFTVGGINAGKTFSNVSVQQMFDDMFFPYVRPTLSLTINPSVLEYGNTTSILVSFTYSQKKNIINSIKLEGGLDPTTLNPYTSTSTTSPQSIIPVFNTTTLFTLSVDDFNYSDTTGYQITDPNVTLGTVSAQFSNKRYWGTFSLDVIGNPDLTTDSGSASDVALQISNSTLIGLSGQELSTSYLQTRTSFGGGGYHILAWPTSFGSTPSFIVNGLNSSAYTRVLDSWTFSNYFGYEELYDVWVSNTKQNSSVGTLQIT